MEPLVIVGVAVGALVMPVAAARGMLALVLRVMTLARPAEPFTVPTQHTPASL